MAKATVSLKDVWLALDECAKGYSKTEKLHSWWVHPPGGGAMCRLPLGPHGNRRNVDIECGHVRSLARQFDIMDCMKRKIPGLT